MARKLGTGRKRKIRELLNILDSPDVLWRPIHTDMLVTLAVTDADRELYKPIDAALSKQYRDRKRELHQDRKKIFQEELEAQLPKVAKALELLTEYGFAKAIDPETGEIDITKLSDKDAKVALQAMGLTMKSLGLLTTKLEVNSDGNVFDVD